MTFGKGLSLGAVLFVATGMAHAEVNSTHTFQDYAEISELRAFGTKTDVYFADGRKNPCVNDSVKTRFMIAYDENGFDSMYRLPTAPMAECVRRRPTSESGIVPGEGNHTATESSADERMRVSSQPRGETLS